LAYWRVRESLSQQDKIKRSFYELLRDELDQFMIQYTLVSSFNQFCSRNLEYPFVEMRELKPRARIPDQEYECQRSALVIFVEDTIPAEHKKYIRLLDSNKIKKKNLLRSKSLPLNGKFERNQKYLDAVHFFDFMEILLPVDYALLIQRDPASAAKNRYSLSHFHVRIDWPVAEAAEDLARSLRYISKDLYEKGDKTGEDLQKKFFEYYGQPFMAGGRRTAAIVASQYLQRIACITTVYAGSSESRALIRISERGVAKLVLLKLPPDTQRRIAEQNNLSLRSFNKNYVVARDKKQAVVVFQTTYHLTEHARPPDDGKLRELKADLNWLTVDSQFIMAKPGVLKRSPLPVNVIYSEIL
jgi:hypothetical protein